MSAREPLPSDQKPKAPGRRMAWFALAMLGLSLSVIWWWQVNGAGNGTSVDPVSNASTPPRPPPTSPDPATGTSAQTGAPTRSTAAILQELRRTYRPGGVVPRIRLQGELTERWEKTPPSAAEVIAEIADGQAPSEHRVYIAHSFRNLAKMNRFDAKEAADAVDALLKIVADGKDDPLVRGQMAIILANFDKSPEAVRAAAGLLDVPSDDAGYLAVTALRHTATDEAAKVLNDFLKRDVAVLDTKTRTTAAALLALVGYEKVDITPVARQIGANAQSLALIQAVFLSLAKASSSMTVLEAILQTYNNAGHLPHEDRLAAESLGLKSIQKHAQFIAGIKSSLPADVAMLERINQLFREKREKLELSP